MHVVRDILDKQLLHQGGQAIGRVDGLVAIQRPGQPPELAFIETGPAVLAARVHPRLGSWLGKLLRRLFGDAAAPRRLPWSMVRDVGLDVRIDLDARQIQATPFQDWMRDHIVGRIPGGK